MMTIQDLVAMGSGMKPGITPTYAKSGIPSFCWDTTYIYEFWCFTDYLITSSTKFRLGFVWTIIEKCIRTVVIDMSTNDTDTKNYWFRAQRYGWGWGLPLTWQGWIIVIAYTVMIIAGIFIFPLNLYCHDNCWHLYFPPKRKKGFIYLLAYRIHYYALSDMLDKRRTTPLALGKR
jgi:hypothetical protein